MLKKSLLICFATIMAVAMPSCMKDEESPATTPPAPAEETSAESEAPADTGSRFAVIDLDAVAQRTGTAVQLQNAIKQRELQLNEQLVQMRGTFQQDIMTKQRSLGDDPSLENQEALKTHINNLNVQLVNAQNTAQSQLSQTQVALINQFRDQVRPIAMNVARENGFSIILTKNEAVLFAYDVRADITNEVVRRLTTPMVP